MNLKTVYNIIMSVFLRLEDLFEQCLDNESLRIILRRNHLSLIGDFEDKIHRLVQAVLSGEIKFRENFLHFISSEETREMAYQIGLDTDGPIWKVKEDIYYWFDQSFEELSGWDERDQINLNSQNEILNWIKTGSLGQIQKVCFYIEKYLDEQNILYEFSNFDSKDVGVQRLAACLLALLCKRCKLFWSLSKIIDRSQNQLMLILPIKFWVYHRFITLRKSKKVS